MLILSDYIGEGFSRRVYSHPKDPRFCVKINKTQNPSSDQNKIDLFYSGLFERRRIDSPHIPKVFGEVDTNYGKGIVVERILLEGFHHPVSIKEAVERRIVSKHKAEGILSDLFDFLIDKGIIVVDINLEHYVLRKWKGDIICSIIDGVQVKTGGVIRVSKYRARLMLPFLASAKTTKSKAQALSMLRKEIEALEARKRLHPRGEEIEEETA